MPFDLSLVQKIAIWALPVLFAITVHEAAHGYAARALGDRTAEMLGRLSLNPVRHIDPVGTLLVPALMLWAGGFLFGWAKPVPVAMKNLRSPRRDMALVAIAGPLSNAAMALGWAILLKIALMQGATEGLWLGVRLMAVAGIAINVMLLVLNLLPLPPLDGGRVLSGARLLDRVEPYGLVILIVLLVTGLLGKLLVPPLMLAQGLLYKFVGVNPGGLF
jgi:Zn-dependent protease